MSEGPLVRSALAHDHSMKIAEVRRYALSLPDATEEPHFEYSSFRVRRKIFVTVPPDQEHIHVFVGESERERALALYPNCLEKLVWGSKVCGLRVHLRKASPSVVNGLIRKAWLLKAPKRLIATLGGTSGRWRRVSGRTTTAR